MFDNAIKARFVKCPFRQNCYSNRVVNFTFLYISKRIFIHIVRSRMTDNDT